MTNKPRIIRIEQKYEPTGVELAWSAPETGADIGSVLVYRSDLGRNGTFSIISTEGVSDNQYIDSIGSEDSWYKVQYYDGTGSSPFSDVNSLARFNYLCTDEDVRKILSLSANQDDIGSEEIEDAILDSQDELFGEYGKPIKRTYTEMTTLGSEYWIKENLEPIHNLDRIIVNDKLVAVGSYVVDLSNGKVVFDSTFRDSEVGTWVEFEWTPKIFHLLCKNLAAMDLIEDFTIKDGDAIKNPQLIRIERRIERYEKRIANPKVPFGSSTEENYNERIDAEYVNQNFGNVIN